MKKQRKAYTAINFTEEELDSVETLIAEEIKRIDNYKKESTLWMLMKMIKEARE